MLKITLSSRKNPIKLKMCKDKGKVKGEILSFNAVYYILVDEVDGVANIYNSWTHIKYKINQRGFYIMDQKTLEGLKKNPKVICEEATLQDISLLK